MVKKENIIRKQKDNIIKGAIEKEQALKNSKEKMNRIRQLTELISLKDKLITIVSHDIRKPVANMVNLVEMLEEEAHYNEDSREIIEGVKEQVKDAYEFLKDNKADLAFVDINMPGESGLDFAHRVTSEFADISVAFLTTHKEYALEAFDVYAYDYIMKPVSQARLENTIKRLKQRMVSPMPAIENSVPVRLSVYCLGGMEVRDSENRSLHFSSSKSAELLAYLLLKKERFVSKWSVMEDVFRGMPLYNAEIYLNTTVYKLRKFLEPFGLKSAVISADESYKFDIRNVYIDFLDFKIG